MFLFWLLLDSIFLQLPLLLCSGWISLYLADHHSYRNDDSLDIKPDLEVKEGTLYSTIYGGRNEEDQHEVKSRKNTNDV